MGYSLTGLDRVSRTCSMALSFKKLPLGMYVEWIETDGQPYLVRIHLTPGPNPKLGLKGWEWWPFKWRIYLHKFHRPDADTCFHDHPWSFWTFVLWGQYVETSHDRRGSWITTSKGENLESPTGRIITDTLRMGSIRNRAASHAHRIATVRPGTITLVFRSERKRDWGFWTLTTPVADNPRDSRRPVWRWIYWRDFMNNHDTSQGEAY